jgi:hypothetical protein
MMNEMVEPGGPPSPRRQDTAIEALREDAPATGNCGATEASRHNDEADRSTGHGQVSYTPQIPTVDTVRAYPTFRAGARPARGADGDQRGRAIADGALHHESGRDKRQGRRAFRMMVIPPKHHQPESGISSKVSQSQFCKPIGIRVFMGSLRHLEDSQKFPARSRMSG